MTDYTITYHNAGGGLSTFEIWDASSSSDAIAAFAAHDLKYTALDGLSSVVSCEEGTCFDAENQ